MNALADTLIIALVFATLAQAWSWLGSYAGIISLGHAVFFGIGAYAVAISNLRGGSPWFGALGGGLLAVMLAVLCGLVFLRGRGYVFTAVTLVAGISAASFVAAHHWVGPGNAFTFPLHRGFLLLQFGEKWPYLLIAALVFALTQTLTYGLRATRAGLYLRALRSNAVAARSVGIAARPLRLLALVSSAFVTSVAGSFFAQYRLAVDPRTDFSPAISLDIALIAVIAGPASPWGAPLAALVYVVVATAVPLHPTGLLGGMEVVLEVVMILAVAAVRAGDILNVFGRLVAPATARRAA